MRKSAIELCRINMNTALTHLLEFERQLEELPDYKFDRSMVSVVRSNAINILQHTDALLGKPPYEGKSHDHPK